MGPGGWLEGGMIFTDADRFAGALLGCAVGDMVGAAWLSGELPDPRADAPRASGREACVSSDASGLALALAETLVDSGGDFDLGAVATSFGRWMKRRDEASGSLFVFDEASEIACRRLYLGCHPRKSAVFSRSSGAATRAAPLGLLDRSMKSILKMAVLQARLTHRHPEALAGAAAIALAVNHAVEAVSFHPDAFLDDVALPVEDIAPGLAAKISDLQRYLSEPLKVGFHLVGSSASSLDAVPAALLAFARQPHSFESAVVEAVYAADSPVMIGAMVGSLSGALNGAAAVPRRWIELLGNPDGTELLAQALFKTAFGSL